MRKYMCSETEARAKQGVTIVNASKVEPIVMLKHFAYNPQLQASGLLEE